MAFITYPLNNIDYTAEDAELFHCTRTSGIWAEDSFSISVTGDDNNVTIGTGIAWINNEEFSGKVAALKSAEVLDLGIADDSTYPRIDVIAIQFNANNNATDVIVKKGTPASNPVRPAIIRSGAVYELYLASVYRPAGAPAIAASDITDLRMDKTVCGLMADSVTSVDTSAINAQVKALIANLDSEIQGVKDTSGLMYASDWIEDDKIPIDKVGINADNAEDALANLGGLSMELIWANASPTSAFKAQDITISGLSSYPFVAVVGREGINDNANVLSFAPKGVWARIMLFYNARQIRPWNYGKTKDVIHFEDGEYGLEGANASKSNNFAIPVLVYGIKGVQ